MNPEISYYRLGGLQASGNFLIKKVPTAGDTITIDGETFTFGTTFNGDTIYDVARSLKLAINADSSTYAHAHTSINPSRSTYAIYYGPRVVVVASVPGTAGNSIAIASSNTDAIEASGATLSGGTAGPLIGGGGGTPGDTVITETTYGQAESAGVATEFSRADHTHGTPALPTPADIGADATGTAASAVASHAAGTGVHAIAATTGLQSALDERTGSRLAILGEGARTLVSGSVWASTVQDNHVRQTVASSTACVVRISFGNYISPFGGGDCGYNEFDLSTSFRAMLVVVFDGFVSSAAKAAIYIPGANTETAAVIGAKGIGIHVVGNAAGNQLMSVAVHNGTSLTESTPAEMAAGSSKSHNIALEWRAGVSATLYVNGVQWGQVTTGLPTGTIPSARFIAAVFDTGAGVGAYSTFGIRGILVESL